MSSVNALVSDTLQVCLQGSSSDRLLRGSSSVRCLLHVYRWRLDHAPVLRFPASRHCPPPAESSLLLLCPAALGAPPAPICPTHCPAHPSPHGQVTDGWRCGWDVSSRLPGEVYSHHLQTRGSAYKNRHAQEALPGVGRSLRGQAPA